MASLKRLSPFSTAMVRFGSDTDPNTAVAAAASGGATMAPSAMAAASGRPMRATPIHATAAVVTRTAPIARIASGRQRFRAAPIGKS